MPNKSDKLDRQQRAEQMRKERERADKRRRNGITVGIVAVVVVLIAVAAFAINQEIGKNNAPAVAPNGVTKDGGVVYDQAAATGKPATTQDPVKVVLYEDFQCPACQSFESAVGNFLQQSVASGAISVEYRPIAFLDKASSTNYSTRALNAAACVVDEKGPKAFYDLHSTLYRSQPPEGGAGLEDSQLESFAEQAGASGDGSCISEGTFEKWSKDITEKASAAGVSGTPTVQVEGKVVEGPVNPQTGEPSTAGLAELQAAISAAKK